MFILTCRLSCVIEFLLISRGYQLTNVPKVVILYTIDTTDTVTAYECMTV